MWRRKERGSASGEKRAAMHAGVQCLCTDQDGKKSLVKIYLHISNETCRFVFIGNILTDVGDLWEKNVHHKSLLTDHMK